MKRSILLAAAAIAILAASSVRAHSAGEKECEALNIIADAIATSIVLPFTLQFGSVNETDRRTAEAALENSKVAQAKAQAAEAAYDIVASSAPHLIYSDEISKDIRSDFAGLFLILDAHEMLAGSVSQVYLRLMRRVYSRVPADNAASAAVRVARSVLLARGFQTMDRNRTTYAEKIIAAAASSLQKDAWRVSQAQFYHNEKYGDGISVEGVREISGLVNNAGGSGAPTRCAGTSG